MKLLGQTALGAVLALSLASGACGKLDVHEDFSGLAGLDEKSDAFSTKMRLLGTLTYGQVSAAVRYTNPPRFRAYKFSGSRNDAVKVRVLSTSGDAVTWVTDAAFNIIGYNDDASSGTLDSFVSVRLPGNRIASNKTYYIIFRDYYMNAATFTVKLDGPTPAPDFTSCAQDSDCEKTYAGCCPLNTYTSVRRGTAGAYHTSLGCAAAPICPRPAIHPDNQVAICGEQRKCTLIKPEEIICAGFRLPSPRQCPTGYACTNAPGDGDPRADAPSHCYRNCGGIAALTCDPGYQCIDAPYDDCDPARGGADCPGICTPTPADCRTSGCGSGSSCTFCWGSYACVPDGAVC